MKSTFYGYATFILISWMIILTTHLLCIKAFHLHQNVELHKNGFVRRPGQRMKHIFLRNESMRQKIKLNNRIKPDVNTILEDQDISQSRRNIFKTCTKSLVPLAVLSGRKVPAAHSISPEKAASSYDKYAANYDSLDGGDIASTLGIDEARSKLLSMAKGDVLEIGVGTGLNIPKYHLSLTNKQQEITSITFVDVSNSMLEQAKVKAFDTIPRDVKVNFYNADATSELVDLFGESAFDTVLDTFSLCVMGRKGAEDCLKQMGRVVKKKDQGGKLID